MAGPANPNAIKTYQADGSYFYSFKKGDEHQRWTETLEGYSVILNRKTKNWEYAVKAKGGLLMPSGEVVGPDGIAPPGFEKHIRPIRFTEDEKRTAELLNFKLADSLDSIELFRNTLGGYQRIKNATIIGESPNKGTHGF